MKLRFTPRAAAVAGAFLFLISGISQSTAQSGPFSGLAGSWAGNGTVSLSDGSRERIRCRAVYTVNAASSGLEQSLRCASDSYKIELSSNVTAQGGNLVSGTWSESTRNIHGNLQGKAAGGEMDIFVEAAGFAANLNIATRGNRQSVNIRSQGEIRSVSINLSRS